MAVLTREINVIRAGLTNLSTELSCVDVQCCSVGETSALMVDVARQIGVVEETDT